MAAPAVTTDGHQYGSTILREQSPGVLEANGVALGGGGDAEDVAFTPVGTIAATDVQAAIAELDTEKVAKAGGTMTGNLVVTVGSARVELGDVPFDNGASTGSGAMAKFSGTAGSTARAAVMLEGDGFATGWFAARYGTGTTPAANTLMKAHGTPAAPTLVVDTDVIGRLGFTGYVDGAVNDFVSFGSISIIAAGTISSTNRPGRYVLTLGTAATTTEVARWEVDTGLSMYGANPVIDGNRLLVNRTAALAGLHTGAAGKQEFATDLGGGAGLLVHDGTRYTRTASQGYAEVATDADFTWTPLTSAGEIRHTGTLTAARAVTLSTTGAYPGLRVRFTRTGSGAFNLNIGTGPLKALATNTVAEFVYDGAAWYLAADVQAYSALLAAQAALSDTSGTIEKTGAATVGVYTVTTAAKTVLDDTTVGAMLTTLTALPLAGGTMTGALIIALGATPGWPHLSLTAGGVGALSANVYTADNITLSFDAYLDNGAGFYARDTSAAVFRKIGDQLLIYADDSLTTNNLYSPTTRFTMQLSTGAITLTANLQAPSYYVAGVKVVGARGASVADASGGAIIDIEARAALNALISRCEAHGLIATV